MATTTVVRESDPLGFVPPPRYQIQPSPWMTVLVVLMTWLMSAAMTYGILSTKIQYLEDRVTTLERHQLEMLENQLTRGEYERYTMERKAEEEKRFEWIQEKLEKLSRR
jgi:hypothetical protein